MAGSYQGLWRSYSSPSRRFKADPDKGSCFRGSEMRVHRWPQITGIEVFPEPLIPPVTQVKEQAIRRDWSGVDLLQMQVGAGDSCGFAPDDREKEWVTKEPTWAESATAVPSLKLLRVVPVPDPRQNPVGIHRRRPPAPPEKQGNSQASPWSQCRMSALPEVYQRDGLPKTFSGGPRSGSL